MTSISKEHLIVSRHKTLCFVPDLRGFERMCAIHWNQIYITGRPVWSKVPTKECYLMYCGDVLRLYMHLIHYEAYGKHNFRTEGLTKLKNHVEGIKLPRFLRDICREMSRPMTYADTYIIPYLPLIGGGTGIIPALGADTQFDVMCSQALSNLGDLDMVDLVHETPAPANLSIVVYDEDEKVDKIVFYDELKSWRLDAVSVLRHLDPFCLKYLRYTKADYTVGPSVTLRFLSYNANVDLTIDDLGVRPESSDGSVFYDRDIQIAEAAARPYSAVAPPASLNEEAPAPADVSAYASVALLDAQRALGRKIPTELQPPEVACYKVATSVLRTSQIHLRELQESGFVHGVVDFVSLRIDTTLAARLTRFPTEASHSKTPPNKGQK